MSHHPERYLERCQQTGPHTGVPGRGARGRQGGAHVCANTHTRGCGITGGDDNTVRHIHKVQKRSGVGDQLTGISQAPNCARLGLVPAQSSVVPEH